MGSEQVLRGNPEAKIPYLTTGFQGGMDITHADDFIPTNMVRKLINFESEVYGEVSTRRGYGLNKALTELLYPNSGTYHNAAVDLDLMDEVFFTLIDNPSSAWKRLADSPSLAYFRQTYGDTTAIRYLRLFVVKTSGALYWEDVRILIGAVPTITRYTGTITQATFKHDNVLFNLNFVDKYGRLYLTSNDKGLLIYDSESTTPTTPFTYIGSFTGKTNEAYKPNAIEVRKLGFNVLGDSPLNWVYESDLTTETIQGVYITTPDRIPLQIVPSGSDFQVNILYTGDTHVFTIAMNAYEDTIELTATKNMTYSVSGSLAVYDISLKTQPSDEVEIVIEFDSETVVLDPYYDYYQTGTIPGTATPVAKLEVGEFNITEIYDRLVYYKGNAVWFSEVDVYDYIPNYNYVLLPIDSTDEIVKIVYFRTNYIVFTKNRIYRLSGDFEANTFRLDLVNRNIGCIAPNTIAVVQNELYFLSVFGLRSLKTDTFRENFENVKEFDEAIYPLIKHSDNAYGIVFEDQYILHQNLRGVVKEIQNSTGLKYRIPDVVRQYYKNGSYMVDIYPNTIYPAFIIMESGHLYSFKSNGLYRYGDAFTDFGQTYTTIFETSGYSFGYPLHEKKIKSVLIKGNGGSGNYDLTVELLADGEVVLSNQFYPVGVSETGDILYSEYEAFVESGLVINEQFGAAAQRQHVKKLQLNGRGKNIATRIIADSNSRLTLVAFGYIYKLGKIRGT